MKSKTTVKQIKEVEQRLLFQAEKIAAYTAGQGFTEPDGKTIRGSLVVDLEDLENIYYEKRELVESIKKAGRK